MKELTIISNEDGSIQVQANAPLTLNDILDLTLSANLAVMNSSLENVPTENKEQLKEHLFNTFNIAASALLAQFAPEIDLRPDITEEALLKAELEIANDKLSNM